MGGAVARWGARRRLDRSCVCPWTTRPPVAFEWPALLFVHLSPPTQRLLQQRVVGPQAKSRQGSSPLWAPSRRPPRTPLSCTSANACRLVWLPCAPPPPLQWRLWTCFCPLWAPRRGTWRCAASPAAASISVAASSQRRVLGQRQLLPRLGERGVLVLHKSGPAQPSPAQPTAARSALPRPPPRAIPLPIPPQVIERVKAGGVLEAFLWRASRFYEKVGGWAVLAGARVPARGLHRRGPGGGGGGGAAHYKQFVRGTRTWGCFSCGRSSGASIRPSC